MKWCIQCSENLGFRLLLEREERDRILKMGVGVQTRRKELGGVAMSGKSVSILEDAFAGKGGMA